MKMDTLPSEIFLEIFNYLDLIDQLHIRSISKYFLNFHILVLYDNYEVLTDEIMSYYPYVVDLCINYNKQITNLNDMKDLRYLGADATYLSDQSINELYDLE